MKEHANLGLGDNSWEYADGYTLLASYVDLSNNNPDLKLTVDYVDKTAPHILKLVKAALTINPQQNYTPDQLNPIASAISDEFQRRVKSGEIEI